MDNSTKRQSNRGQRRPVSLVLREEDCNGLLPFLETLQYGAESKLMRAILIDWFKTQMAAHGANVAAAANELIQKYEIIFLQQRHGIQFSSVEHQPKKRDVRSAPARVNPQPELQITPVEIGNVDTQSRPEVVADSVPAPIASAPVFQSEDPLPPRPSSPPAAPSNVSGEVDVDGILGL